MLAKVTINQGKLTQVVFDAAHVLSQSYGYDESHLAIMDDGGDPDNRLVVEIHDAKLSFNDKYIYGSGYRKTYEDNGAVTWDHVQIRIEPMFELLPVEPIWTQEMIDSIKKNGREMYRKICGEPEEV